jgi:glycosyltransferase involved in cell wall biosynthesis|tara:strand:- start:68 stop:865 length:798 start_codon:yes stop_codon:yes gene_type:complete
MKNNTKVSILMTCYNASKFIEQSIKSIKNQTYKNWELVIIDDLSTDKTIKIIKKFNDKRIKIFYLKKHIGRTKALNYGLKKISSKLIAILDADDLAHKNRIKTQVEFLEDNRNTSLVGTWYKVIDEKGKFIELVKTEIEKDKIYKNMLVRNVFCHSSIMFRKSIINKIGNYPSEIIYSQDYAFLLKAMKLQVPSIIPKYLTISRRWSNSMTYSSEYKKNIKIDSIKHMLYSIKNFKFTFKSSFLLYLKFIKNLIELTLIKLFLTE